MSHLPQVFYYIGVAHFGHGSIGKKSAFFGGLAPEIPAARVDPTKADATTNRYMNSRRKTSCFFQNL